jgi:hypothetical protein
MQVGGMKRLLDDDPAQQPPKKYPPKSASARSRPIEGTLTVFLEKYGISKAEWDAGRLINKGIAELPPLLPWPEGLKTLDLSMNQIVDVSPLGAGRTLPELTELNLGGNQ